MSTIPRPSRKSRMLPNFPPLYENVRHVWLCMERQHLSENRDNWLRPEDINVCEETVRGHTWNARTIVATPSNQIMSANRDR